MIAVHLNHPCSTIDVCEVSDSDYLKIKCQGYIPLEDLRKAAAELTTLRSQLAERDALIAALRAELAESGLAALNAMNGALEARAQVERLQAKIYKVLKWCEAEPYIYHVDLQSALKETGAK